MIFATLRRCIGWWHGIGQVRTFSSCFRNSPPTLATSMFDRRNAICNMTPDLLQAANQRFAQYAMGGDHQGC